MKQLKRLTSLISHIGAISFFRFFLRYFFRFAKNIANIYSNFCNREKSVCVCIVLVHRGPFPQEINGKSVKLAVWAVSKVIFSVETSLVFGIIKVPASFLHEDCISLCLVFVSVLSLLVHDSGTRVFGLITFPALLYYGDVRVREAVVNEIVPKHSETYFQKAFALS